MAVNLGRVILIFSVVLATFLLECRANDILGCGGFVKSHANLDFSKIEIGLYTKDGALKERTECAPTNGYYFLPLYEKGEYVLKVHPPAGWSFEPSQVELLVDGETDRCSSGQDINFTFNGFGITGKVITAGQSEGPSGVSVQLVNEKGDKRETVTAAGGEFHFTPVIPGKYTVKASHPKWKLEPSQAVVQVKEGNTVLVAGALAVKGYDVAGSVSSHGNPLAGLHVLLYSKENPKFRVEGCQTALLQGVPDSPICYSVTDASGVFSFGLVPAGDYSLLALAKSPGQAIVQYNVRPDSVKFTVKHDSQFIKDAFEVTGYTLTGSVSTGAGQPLAGARVSLDGQAAGVTDSAGKYTLRAAAPGAHAVSFQHEQCELDDVKLTISPNGAVSLPEARVARWKVCGTVTPSEPRNVLIQAETSSLVQSVAISNDGKGKWCTYLPMGVYNINVEVSDKEQKDGLQFYPLSERVTVSSAPVEGVMFSQLYCEVQGKVQCAVPQCRNLAVTLKSLANGNGKELVTRTKEADGSYSFSNVLPGTVQLSVSEDALCWRDAALTVRVAAAAARAPPFVHSGYRVTVRAKYDATVKYTGATSKDSGEFEVKAPSTRVCLSAADRYSLTPRSCHRYEPETVIVDTTKDVTDVTLTAVAHATEIEIVSPHKVSDLRLQLTGSASADTVGPLTGEPAGGNYVYRHTFYLKTHEVSALTATSSSLLFSPPSQQLTAAGCQRVPLSARAAVTLRGRVVPAVAGAVVTVTSDSSDLKLSMTTGPDGAYSFGPLDAAQHYTVTAEKESYVMGAREANGDISARRLAEIVVTVQDEATGQALEGAVVSLSGGSYRKNLITGPSGSLRFSSLAPAQYYLKPLLKEYRFSPPATIVNLPQGQLEEVVCKGTRVAHSCFGSLVSISGGAWAGATVTAAPLTEGKKCTEEHATTAADGGFRHLVTAAPLTEGKKCTEEHATTTADGGFRIRGLLPECRYSLQLRDSSVPELAGLRLVTPTQVIEKDISGVRLIAIQPHQLTDATVLIHAPNVDHYKSLRLKLALEDNPASPVYTTKLDAAGYHGNNNPGLMYVLPRLPADNKTYVLTVESSLSKATHSYEDEVVYFTSDGQYKSFDIEFAPKVKSGDQELRQTSLLVVPLLAALGAAFLYRDVLIAQLIEAASGALDRARVKTTRVQRPEVLDKASIDQIVSSVNAAGKKQGKKKTPFSN
ncbi:nodal modulator 1 [Plutella xylostella]|uniref:nodal modulator 1 n=1 Tax=Plutella xylostella TaxID=51655 RepID=UPI0020322147|nr:nodal modulator 1 [Plutella xylostella]